MIAHLKFVPIYILARLRFGDQQNEGEFSVFHIKSETITNNFEENVESLLF